MSQLSRRVAARYVAQQQEETAGWFMPTVEELREKAAPLWAKVEEAAKAHDADTLGEYMSQIYEIYRRNPVLQGEVHELPY